MVTPFQDGAIDFIGLRRLVSHLLEKHVAGIMVCTTTGEAAALSRQEQLAVLDAVLQLVPAQRVVMGLSGNNQMELLQFQKDILQRPLAGLLVPAPSYIRPSQAGLEAFFRAVADASSVPIILYDIPYRTGATFEQATLLNIVAHERIVAIKDCGGNLAVKPSPKARFIVVWDVWPAVLSSSRRSQGCPRPIRPRPAKPSAD